MFVRFDVDEDALSDSDVIVTIFVLIPYHVYIHFPTNSMLSGNKNSFFLQRYEKKEEKNGNNKTLNVECLYVRFNIRYIKIISFCSFDPIRWTSCTCGPYKQRKGKKSIKIVNFVVFCSGSHRPDILPLLSFISHKRIINSHI